MDPISNLTSISSAAESQSMLIRLIDFENSSDHHVGYSLTSGGRSLETEVGVSSIADTWILLRDMETGGERNRLLFSEVRGMPHSNQLREFV